MSTALERAKAAGLTHLNLDGTVIRTDRLAAPDRKTQAPWRERAGHHYPGRLADLRLAGTAGPGARHHLRPPPRAGRGTQPHRGRAGHADPGRLGYENAGDGFRHPCKKPAGGELTKEQQTYNKVIRAIHGVCERANSLLKTTFKALRRVSLDPSRITKIAAAALVLLQLEYDRIIVVVHYWERLSGPSRTRQGHWPIRNQSTSSPYVRHETRPCRNSENEFAIRLGTLSSSTYDTEGSPSGPHSE
ncbi:hypothetical protein OK006_5238 [Actinobacteria bacterium OK006]|nr:hypothetical protein OK006_5238 [Actinobacteria bacterium OK006]